MARCRFHSQWTVLSIMTAASASATTWTSEPPSLLKDSVCLRPALRPSEFKRLITKPASATAASATSPSTEHHLSKPGQASQALLDPPHGPEEEVHVPHTSFGSFASAQQKEILLELPDDADSDARSVVCFFSHMTPNA
mmetsp:Transcript_38715/g.76722  ORF Transcript_38715/g.76722 Transcript_38715/m.76722 type:complete len:139 (-) Transcript_38715:307-723(-)